MNVIERYCINLANDLAKLDPGVVLLAVIIVAVVIVLDAVGTFTRKRKKASGFEVNTTTVSIDGGKSLPVRHYLSEMQGLAGRPDALISEDGFIIPVERKPLARKIRDRYVLQLLVYMRLVEEFEGKRPPYGYLILGPNCRRVKIMNSNEKQAWLQRLIDEMRAAFAGGPVKPTPHPVKCSKCDVKHACQFSLERKTEEQQ